MSQPSGAKTVVCHYCGGTYTRTNWMRLKGLKDADGFRIEDTHQLACVKAGRRRGSPVEMRGLGKWSMR